MLINLNTKYSFINTYSGSFQNFRNTKTYSNLSPLPCDIVSFSGNISDDLMNLPAKKIIDICKLAIKNGTKLGEGREAVTYKIENYPEYCLRQEKVYEKSGDFNINEFLDNYDKANHVVARLDGGTTIMKYIPGIPVKNIDSFDPLKTMKNEIRALLANEFEELPFLKVIEQVEDAKSNGIDFDRFGENIHVDPLNHEIVCIDFSPKIKDYSGEYNPISYIYDALDVDGTQYSKRVFGKLCSAYAQRLIDSPINKLNFDKLDMNFYHRGCINDPFNHFPEREILTETRDYLRQIIKAKKDNKPKEELAKMVADFKDYIDNNVMSFNDFGYFPYG